MIGKVIETNTYVGPVAKPDDASELRSINWNIAASVTFLFWDMLLLLDREVKYIWKPKFSLITAVFCVVRLCAVALSILYFAIGVGVFSLTDDICKHILWFQSLSALVLTTASDILLISRVYAFYARNKALLISLCVLETLALIAVLCTIIIVVPQARLIPSPFPSQLHIGGCVSLFFPTFIGDIWIPVLCVQTVLFGLAGGRHLYLQRGNRMTISRLYYTFIRDGVWCFFVLLVIYLLCIIGVELNDVSGLIAFYWCFPFVGACTSRLILNLRSANSEDHSLASDSPKTNTKMKFAKPQTMSVEINTTVNDIYQSTQNHEEA